ncbi:MAG: DUF1345 domain-containing protein [Williamsia sp.]|nr:DUF1345 domain-containing protein [Williamsia sp.]
MPSFLRLVDHIPRNYRYLTALMAGILIFLLAWPHFTAAITFLISWIGFAGFVLFFAWITILVKHPKQISTVASEQDASYAVIFIVVVLAAFISLFAIILLLRGLPTGSRSALDAHIVLSVVAVALSWVLIHTLFTIRYAHLYYTLPSGAVEDLHNYAGGLIFPGNELPDFLDFAYFSFVLGMTFQTADVNIAGRAIRRLALLHGFLSFVYNTTIIALSINIISGIVGH